MGFERDSALLTHSARQANKALIANVERHHGVRISPAHMARDPWTQARLWRQSRSGEQVRQAVRKLEYRGAPWLKSVLESVGPQASGPWRTNALPGQSWHQLGEAVDYFVLNVDGSANWDGEHRGYLVLAEEAARLGLTSGYFWVSRDPGHIQLRRVEVHDAYSWPQIDNMMHERWRTFPRRG